MYCGPIRHRMGERVPEDSGFVRALAVHQTVHSSASAEVDGRGDMAGPSIQSVFRGLVEDEDRTRQICADIAAAHAPAATASSCRSGPSTSLG